MSRPLTMTDADRAVLALLRGAASRGCLADEICAAFGAPSSRQCSDILGRLRARGFTTVAAKVGRDGYADVFRHILLAEVTTAPRLDTVVRNGVTLARVPCIDGPMLETRS